MPSINDHPEYRLTYWHLVSEIEPESLWFYCVEDVAERIFDHCRRCPDHEWVTFVVEWWGDRRDLAAIVRSGPPRNLLAVYGWPSNLENSLMRDAARRAGG